MAMTFDQALEKLTISEYSERIFNSNSHGELFHCADYIHLAETIREKEIPEFRKVFVGNIKHAEKTWKRPESAYQHVLKMIKL